MQISRITTYETYHDYHHSFGGVRFFAAVFDECQKIKNPKSQVNKALESVNADFRIAMTGTPIENAMEDLWAILNQAWPGFLGSLKDFSPLYNQNNPDKLEALNTRLKAPAAKAISAPILWRRMKDNILEDLPKKTLHPIQVMMPPIQAEAYSQIIARAKSSNPPPML